MQGPVGRGRAHAGLPDAHDAGSAVPRGDPRDRCSGRHEQARAAFAKLPAAEQDAWLQRLEDAKLPLPTADAKTFFELLQQNTLEGFWSDPIYGGNRDMAGWKLIGFPGARYDHSPWVAKHGKPYPLPPVGLRGRGEWSPRGETMAARLPPVDAVPSASAGPARSWRRS